MLKLFMKLLLTRFEYAVSCTVRLIVTPRSLSGGGSADFNLPTWPGDIVTYLAALDKPDEHGKKSKFPVYVSLTAPMPQAPLP